MSEHVNPPAGPEPAQPAVPAHLVATYRPGLARTVVAVIAACLFTVSEVFNAVLAFAGKHQFVDHAVTGRDDFSPDYRIAYELVAIVTAFTLVIAYLATCVWLWNARRNAEALAPTHQHKQGRGWVWGSWVTPIAFLWFPYVVVRDVATATRSNAARGPSPSNGVLGLWWGLWLASLIAAQVASRLVPWSGDPSASQARALVWAEGFNAALMLAALPFWIVTLVGVNRSQQSVAKAWHSDSAQQSMPAPERSKVGGAWLLTIVPVLAVGALLFVGALAIGAVTDAVSDPTGAGANDDSGEDDSGVGPGDSEDTDLTKLVRGDCLYQEMPAGALPETVKVVPCNTRHFHEVFATLELGPGPYPGEERTQQLAEGRCLAAFRRYVGISPRKSELDVLYTYPIDEAQWNYDPAVICLVSGARSTSTPLGGSRR